ncbi:MAG: tripartite tricarboxylate transporter substrate binding protein [Betaproteobacteria bacterium]|nr:tripartite tricarboxylate transporter substrate binding protein [Betaproteobacteria bacterium]
MTARTLRFLTVISSTGVLLGANALAQSWPQKPIRVIVPYPAGGTTDIMARVLQPKLGSSIGQPIIVENRPGGNGVIGAEIVARAAPDGYTLMLTTSATNTLLQFTARSLPYDPVKDFTPVAATGRSRGYIIVNPALPVANFRELLDYAKKFPGKISYGTPNHASSFHLSGAILAEAAGINIVHIPYKGGSEVMRGLVSGEIPMAIISNGSSTSALSSGKAKLIAVLDNDRDPKWPAVASVTESYPAFERTADWTGVFGPAGMARALIQRLNAEIVAAFNSADSMERLANVGLIPQSATPEEFSGMVLRAVEINRKGVKIAGIKQE